MWDFGFFAYENASERIEVDGGGTVDVKEADADAYEKSCCLQLLKVSIIFLCFVHDGVLPFCKQLLQHKQYYKVAIYQHFYYYICLFHSRYT